MTVSTLALTDLLKTEFIGLMTVLFKGYGINVVYGLYGATILFHEFNEIKDIFCSLTFDNKSCINNPGKWNSREDNLMPSTSLWEMVFIEVNAHFLSYDCSILILNCWYSKFYHFFSIIIRSLCIIVREKNKCLLKQNKSVWLFIHEILK